MIEHTLDDASAILAKVGRYAVCSRPDRVPEIASMACAAQRRGSSDNETRRVTEAGSWRRKRARRISLLLILVPAALFGCASAPSAVSQLECDSRGDCDLKWSRAVHWINENSKIKIRDINDSFIETHPSAGDMSAHPAYRITRVPLGGSRFRLELEGQCGGLFGCPGRPTKEVGALQRFIETGQ